MSARSFPEAQIDEATLDLDELHDRDCVGCPECSFEHAEAERACIGRRDHLEAA